MNFSRREFLATLGAASTLPLSTRVIADATGPAPAPPPSAAWLSSAPGSFWQQRSKPICSPILDRNIFAYDFEIQTDKPQQTIEGFGAAFSERGWDALRKLELTQQKQILELLFDKRAGANFSLCRTPIGANDFSLKWYSYDETAGDFALKKFSIKNDLQTLVPFIKSAQAIRGDLKVWASPWSPPTWMKRNKHYSMAQPWPGGMENGIAADQVGKEGKDYFILEPDYIKAYARYFKKYVEAYRSKGIDIVAVMPQNEFNSAQPFPSCCWTPQGLAQFIPALADEMSTLNVEVLLGTLERGNMDLVNQVMANPACRKAIKGVGVQWAGKGALPFLKPNYPDLKIWGTEQECGKGTNDWHYTKYAWGLIKQYIKNGASVYQYWNMILDKDVRSTWGWPQNSLVSIDTDAKTFRLNPEYYLMRHLSAYVQPGAQHIPTASFTGYENQLVFKNPDESLVVLIQNEMSEELLVKAKIGNKLLPMALPADSLNTLVIPKTEYL
jgi:glucosylceramidase